MTFFLGLFVGGICVIVTHLFICTPSFPVFIVATVLSHFSFVGLSMLGTNFLAKRYLFEKAKTVASNQRNLSIYQSSTQLETQVSHYDIIFKL